MRAILAATVMCLAVSACGPSRLHREQLFDRFFSTPRPASLTNLVISEYSRTRGDLGTLTAGFNITSNELAGVLTEKNGWHEMTPPMMGRYWALERLDGPMYVKHYGKEVPQAVISIARTWDRASLNVFGF